ncbi:hypothetical protein [Lacinutrix mariniflava]|uniref:hypothetical protein n=1 Tax=Lacinutrix mariniflava TaxID=342955 RepID=UPI0006E35969|nr:hypothetical protein [Lacinutrix mariniflava]
MKTTLFSLLVIINFFSCKQKKETTTSCYKKDIVVKDKIFDKSEILTSVYYDDNCKIKKIKLITLLDERSGDFEKINDVIFSIGVLKDTIVNVIIPGDSTKIIKNKKISSFNYTFKTPFLDSINYINLETIALVKIKEKIRILKSHPYFYKNSIELLDLKNTHLDYESFNKKNTRFINISNPILKKYDSILVTVKTKKFIDDLTKYKVVINDTISLNFKNNIKASYIDLHLVDQNIKMFNLVKINKTFLTFKLDLSKVTIDTINAINTDPN